MSGQILLDSVIKKLKANYPAGLSEDKLFEFYVADNLLVNFDLDHQEIDSGIVDGSRDAGVDAAYVFINRQLLTDDLKLDVVKQPVEIELVVIQSKNQDNFKEAPLDRLAGSLPLLLDPGQPQAVLETLFKSKVVAVFRSFLTAIDQLAGEFPKVSISITYACKGGEPNAVVAAKAKTLATTLGGKFPEVAIALVGAQELYERSSRQKRLVKELPTAGTPLSGENSYVALCRIQDYAAFVAADDGSLVPRIFDANVRAYQGEVEVNKEIANSLANPTPGVDFWWLNNGVTIVADQAQFMNNRLTIENPLIVNGLQTTHELFGFAPRIDPADKRMVLVRVIVEADQRKRDEIIRATNRQTTIKPSSFRATEPVHREIEDYLLTLGYYYDRRKNFYKHEGKPADRIISIDRLAQGVLAVLLREPHVARARPTTAIKDDDDYREIFSGDKAKHPLPLYGVVVQLLDRVDAYFRSVADQANQVHRNNLKFHVLMVLSWALNGGSNVPAPAIPHLAPDKATPEQLKAVSDWVFQEFDKAGTSDRLAKDKAFTQKLQDGWTPALTAP